MYGQGLNTDPYWDLTAKQREGVRSKRRSGFINERAYRHRADGFFAKDAFTGGSPFALNDRGFQEAWDQEIGHDVQYAYMNFKRTAAYRNLGSVSGAVGGAAVGLGAIGALIGAPITLGVVGLGLAVGTMFGMDMFKATGPSIEEIENVGFSLMGRPRNRFVNTRAAQTMRQASLSAMHNSVYSLRGALGNEASLLHR